MALPESPIRFFSILVAKATSPPTGFFMVEFTTENGCLMCRYGIKSVKLAFGGNSTAVTILSKSTPGYTLSASR